MRFYNREKELAKLTEIRQLAFSNHSRMTVITGRRRIGKTKLIMNSCADSPTVYLFVARNNEAELCRLFSATVRESLGQYVPDGIASFVQLFELLLSIGRNIKYNLVVDEIQEFYNINPYIFSGIQDVWDRYKDSTNVNLIASGSIYTLMHLIFLDYKEPLYGRVDNIIRLRPFTTDVLRTIISDHNPSYTNDDLLALFTITGGVPKYIELLMDSGACTVDAMIKRVTEENSIFLEEGTILLAQEFGKKYGNYFAILSAIASGRNTLSLISEAVGNASLGGVLSRLEDDYELIKKRRPIFSKERSQNVRYEISDNFLRFWFRYIARNQNLVQLGLNDRLREIVESEYKTYSGIVLEEWFKRKLAESGNYSHISSWWERKRGVEANEIDIVAIGLETKEALVAEVKRQRRNYDHKAFMAKIEAISHKALSDYEIKSALYTLEDM